jgi:nicotinate-nucleotide--dimethylbenzimidazole phosphoribosyltransferase
VSAYETAQRAFDGKTKPRGSLGRIEELGCTIAGIRGSVPQRLECVIVVAAGDHGVAAEGVSAYPQEVTAQMVANFAAGGAGSTCSRARQTPVSSLSTPVSRSRSSTTPCARWGSAPAPRTSP